MNDMTQNPQGAQLPAVRNEQEVKAAHDEFAGGVQSGMALPTLSIRGKEFRVRWQGQERATGQRQLDCIVLAARPSVSKRYYKEQYQSGSQDMPDCFSIDGRRPDPSSTEIQAATCGNCPHNQFGSRITQSGSKGKACADYKRLVVLPFWNGQPFEQPVVLDVPATSLKTPKGYRGTAMFLREYFGMLAKHGCVPYDVMTRLEFSDAEYPQLTFGFARNLEGNEASLVQQWRPHDDVQAVLNTEEHDPPQGGQEQAVDVPTPSRPEAPTPQPSQPAPQPAPQQPAPEQPAPAPEAPAQPEPAPQQPAAPEPAPQPRQPAQGEVQPQVGGGDQPPREGGTEQQAAETQPAEQQGGDDDILSEVNDLLKGWN